VTRRRIGKKELIFSGIGRKAQVCGAPFSLKINGL
jgi:hypothetical protein